MLNNPFLDALDVQWGEPSVGTVQARLLDVTGKELTRMISTQPGLTNLHIDLSHTYIAGGVYVLDVWFNSQHHVAKVVKQ